MNLGNNQIYFQNMLWDEKHSKASCTLITDREAHMWILYLSIKPYTYNYAIRDYSWREIYIGKPPCQVILTHTENIILCNPMYNPMQLLLLQLLIRQTLYYFHTGVWGGLLVPFLHLFNNKTI